MTLDSGISNCMTTAAPPWSCAVISTVCARSIFSSEFLENEADVLSVEGVHCSLSSLASFNRYKTSTLGKYEIPWISSGSTQSIFKGSPTTKVPRTNFDLCERLCVLQSTVKEGREAESPAGAFTNLPTKV